MTKYAFCLSNTSGIVESGDTMKFSISQGAMISESSPEKRHSAPKTKANKGAPKK